MRATEIVLLEHVVAEFEAIALGAVSFPGRLVFLLDAPLRLGAGRGDRGSRSVRRHAVAGYARAPHREVLFPLYCPAHFVSVCVFQLGRDDDGGLTVLKIAAALKYWAREKAARDFLYLGNKRPRIRRYGIPTSE